MEVWNKDEYNKRIKRVKSDISIWDKEFTGNAKKINHLKERNRQLSRRKGKSSAYIKILISNRDKMFEND